MAETMIAAQLYTIRDFMKTPADIAASMKKVREIGYEAVQLSGHGPIDPVELKKITDGEGIKICATHTPYDRMRDDPQSVIDEHKLYECEYAGIGGLPQDRRNAEGFHLFAEEASEVAKKLAEGGLTFVYHNHSFEFEKFGDRIGLQILYEDSDPEYFKSELDTYWVQHGGGDVCAWIRKLSGRLPVIHFKDMTMKGREQLFAEIGEGNLNWPGIIEACREAGTRWYIVEQDRCQRDPFESLKISFENMMAMGLK